jgi:hypothetical protein
MAVWDGREEHCGVWILARDLWRAEKSGGGPPPSKTLARFTKTPGEREASWSAPVLWRFGRKRGRCVGPIGLSGGFLAERGLSQTAARGPAERLDNFCVARFGGALRVGTTRAPGKLPAGRAEGHVRSSRRAERQFGMTTRTLWRLVFGA